MQRTDQAERGAGRPGLRGVQAALSNQGRHPNHADRRGQTNRLMRCWHSEAALREALAQLDFQEIVLGRSRFYLAQQIAGDPESISRHLKPIAAGAPAAGNRRSAMRLNIAGLPPMYARRSRRGGLMRYLVSELYAGI